MSKLLVALIISIIWASLVYAGLSPMESIEKYNVIMVHGAADEANGIENCAVGIGEAWSVLSNNVSVRQTA